VNSGLIIDGSKHLNRILSLDVEQRRVTVEPGIVLDDLNRQLKKHGLWFRWTSPPPHAPPSAA
jgi:FAD/FMN-containing dehydrogenase